MRKQEIIKWTVKVAIVAAFVVCILFFNNIMNYFSYLITLLTPFTIGLVIAYIVNMPYKIFYSKAFSRLKDSKSSFIRKLHKPLSVLSAYLVVFAILAFLLCIVIPEITNSVNKLAYNLDSYIIKTEFWIKEVLSRLGYSEMQESNLFEIFNKFSTYVTGENINQLIKNMFSTVTPHLFDITKNFTTTIYNTFIGIIVSIYMLVYKSTLIKQIKKIICALCNYRVSKFLFKVGDVTNNKVGNFIYSKIIDSSIIGIMSCILMSLFKFDYAILISFIIAFFNIIPFFGPIIGAIPGFLILFIVDPIQGFWFLIYVLALQQFDGNILGPAILGDSLGMNAFWIIFSIIVGTGVLGVTGMFLSVPIFAAIYTLVSDYIEKRLQSKKCLIEDKKIIYDDREIITSVHKKTERKVFKINKNYFKNINELKNNSNDNEKND